MNSPRDITRLSQEPAVPCGLLTPALRRDLTDLNAQYLDLGVSPALQDDPWFSWSESVRRCLLSADAATRSRMATAPFALFGLALSPPAAGAAVPRVEDSRGALVLPGGTGHCESFAHQAVFLARRLADGEATVLQLVLDLDQETRRWLVDCRPAQLAEIARGPCLIRPRWRLHTRFWEMLAASARRGTPTALQWAHCVGLSLLGAADADAVPSSPRRRPAR